jgi:hypothetical protein
MADLDLLIARRSAIYAELAGLDSTKAGGRPDNVGGTKHTEYRLSLYAELEKLNVEIDKQQEPWEFPLEGRG